MQEELHAVRCIRMKKILIVLIVVLSTIYIVNADCGVGDANCWNDTPSQGPDSYNGISCIAETTDIVCGINGDSPYCADSSSFTFPNPTVSTTSYTAAYDGGGLINFFDTDGASPYCDNTAAFWCDRNEACQSTEFRKTNCTGFGTYVCGDCRTDGGGYFDCDTDGTPCEIDYGASCGSSTGTYNACYTVGSGGTGNCTRNSNRRDCNNDDSDSNENTCNVGTTCEVVDNAACVSGSSYNTALACFGSNGACDCNSGRKDCDNNDGDSNTATGQAGSTGCEVVNNAACEYGSSYNTALACVGGLGACDCDTNYKDCNDDDGDADTTTGQAGSDGCEYHYNVACAQDASNTSTCNTCACDSNYLDCDGDLASGWGGTGCEINEGSSCGNATGTYAVGECAGSGGNCTRSGTNLDCDDDDSDSDLYTCNGGLNGCEIEDGGACTAAGLPGTYNGCSCEVNNQDIATTGIPVNWSGALPMLWLSQQGLGASLQINHSSGYLFIVNSSGAYYNNVDLSTGATSPNLNDYWNMSNGLLGYTNLTVCADNEILKMNGAAWNCEADATGAGGGEANRPQNTTWIHNETGQSTINESTLLEFIQNNDNDTTILNGLFNTTQFFVQSDGKLGIILSWFSALFDTLFGAKTTDDLTQGSTNLYDNTSWNESHANTLYSTGEHTVDSNASTSCSGTTTYLDGEGNCDDISSVYVDESDHTTTTHESLSLWSTNNFTLTNISNWDAAYGWGNHADAGYSTNAISNDTDGNLSKLYINTLADCDTVNITSEGELICGTDQDTTYTAAGTLLDLTGTVFSLNEGTLTNTKWCKYTSGTGLDCNVEPVVDTNTHNTSTQMQDAINQSGLTYNVSVPCSLISQDAGGDDSDFCNDDSGSSINIADYWNMSNEKLDYHNLSNIPTCSGSDKLTFDGTDFSCAADASGGGGAGTWYTDGTVQINTTTTGGVDDVNITGDLFVGGTIEDGDLGCGNITGATSNLCTIQDTDTQNSTQDMINAINQSTVTIDCDFINFSGTIGSAGICDGDDATGAGGGVDFDQELNTTSSPKFENITVSNKYGHDQDTDTYFEFYQPDAYRLIIGGVEFMDMIESASDLLIFNDDGNNLGFRFEAQNQPSAWSLGGLHGNVRIGNLTNCDTIDTDADGDLSCGTDEGNSTTDIRNSFSGSSNISYDSTNGIFSINISVDTDSSDEVLIDGSRALTSAWDAGSYGITAETFTSDVAIGTSPFTITSTTQVSNLNASYAGLCYDMSCIDCIDDDEIDLTDITLVDFTNDANFIANGTDGKLTGLNMSDYNITFSDDSCITWAGGGTMCYNGSRFRLKP